MFIDPSTISSMVGKTLWGERAKLYPLIKKLSFWLQHGTLRVPIFGPGGAGKSTLAKLLSGEPIADAHYEESRVVEDTKLKGDLTCTLFAVPGQERRAHTWTRFYQDLSAGKSAGIINVVSYGYHSFSEVSFRKTEYYQPGQTKPQFLAAYLAKRREREQQIIETLVPRIGDAKGKLWMITLVTKQDLWWKQRDIVRSHYTEGPYHRCIDAILKRRGEQHFSHEYLSAALLSANFVTKDGELLAPTAAGYDDPLALAHLQKLIEAVTNFAIDCA
jgi:energy-coupling factor transporter ATP-binding protein EcfA2